jgi:putative lipoic acid-binding regulatory protein
MSSENPPKLSYPCAYPIKVLGEQAEDFVSVVLAIVQRHDPDILEEHVSVRSSSKGRYVSVNITITAQGPDHIQALFVDLKASGRVAVVL